MCRRGRGRCRGGRRRRARRGVAIHGEAGYQQVEAQGVQAARVTSRAQRSRRVGQSRVPAGERDGRPGDRRAGLAVALRSASYAALPGGPGGACRCGIRVVSVDLPTHLLADAHRRQQADPLGQLAVDVVSEPGLDVEQLVDERPGPLDGDRPVGEPREGARQVAAEQDGTLDLLGSRRVLDAPCHGDLADEGLPGDGAVPGADGRRDARSHACQVQRLRGVALGGLPGGPDDDGQVSPPGLVGEDRHRIVQDHRHASSIRSNSDKNRHLHGCVDNFAGGGATAGPAARAPRRCCCPAAGTTPSPPEAGTTPSPHAAGTTPSPPAAGTTPSPHAAGTTPSCPAARPTPSPPAARTTASSRSSSSSSPATRAPRRPCATPTSTSRRKGRTQTATSPRAETSSAARCTGSSSTRRSRTAATVALSAYERGTCFLDVAADGAVRLQHPPPRRQQRPPLGGGRHDAVRPGPPARHRIADLRPRCGRGAAPVRPRFGRGAAPGG